MNTRKLFVTVLVVIGLALAALITSRAAALRQPVHSSVSLSNQVFYSPSIESIVNLGREAQVANQVFYSPIVESFVNHGRTQITNQIFYSPTIEGFIH
jgi:hypothetical protein